MTHRHMIRVTCVSAECGALFTCVDVPGPYELNQASEYMR